MQKKKKDSAPTNQKEADSKERQEWDKLKVPAKIDAHERMASSQVKEAATKADQPVSVRIDASWRSGDACFLAMSLTNLTAHCLYLENFHIIPEDVHFGIAKDYPRTSQEMGHPSAPVKQEFGAPGTVLPIRLSAGPQNQTQSTQRFTLKLPYTDQTGSTNELLENPGTVTLEWSVRPVAQAADVLIRQLVYLRKRGPVFGI